MYVSGIIKKEAKKNIEVRIKVGMDKCYSCRVHNLHILYPLPSTFLFSIFHLFLCPSLREKNAQLVLS